MEAHRLHNHYATTGNINMTMGSGKGVSNANNKDGGSHRGFGAANALKGVKKVEDKGLHGGKKAISKDTAG